MEKEPRKQRRLKFPAGFTGELGLNSWLPLLIAAFHRLATIEDAETRAVTFSYDDANRVTSPLLRDGKAVGFAYDENGNVTGVTPPGKPEHVFTYSRRNQLETYVLPDAGEGTATEVRTYDGSNRLKEVQRPRRVCRPFSRR